ncbi:hypothetical protein [Terracidiphilus gabretensis]|uniref:hypothetical protein n=1 Tax=Terracidiphilus gabretensis TaxID=1577687 RepID=UPI0012F85599|nr:hypothetical protein [Terracidiphilus gabretensis]
MRRFTAAFAGFVLTTCLLAAQASAPLPDVHQLMREVVEHQKQLDKVRESYTYTSLQTTQDLDANGKVTKTESTENEDFFVNGHAIERAVKKDGQPLSPGEEKKETERITKLVEKAEKTPADQSLEGQTVSISHLLEVMDVSAPRRESYRGRPTIVFDFVGRKDAKTHGMVEDASKKLKGSIWIDEADRQVAHLEVVFADNFHVAGGLLANIQKGTTFHFDQAPVADGLWLPTGGEAMVQARVLLLKNMRQHFMEKVYGYQRFKVETEQAKDAKVKKD